MEATLIYSPIADKAYRNFLVRVFARYGDLQAIENVLLGRDWTYNPKETDIVCRPFALSH